MTRTRKILTPVGFVAVVLLPWRAPAEQIYEIDPAHAAAQFAVRHMMVSTVRGVMGRVAGTLYLDETDLTRSRVEATVDATGIDTKEPKRDEHLRSPDFLDTARFPTITFRSQRVVQLAPYRF